MKHQGGITWIGWQCVMAMIILIMTTACGSDGDDVADDRGATSIRVTIQGEQDCGYVTHNLDRNLQLWTGSDTWDFTAGLQVTLEAEDPGCDFQGWAEDCAFANPASTCDLTVDKQYNVTAIFVAR